MPRGYDDRYNEYPRNAPPRAQAQAQPRYMDGPIFNNASPGYVGYPEVYSPQEYDPSYQGYNPAPPQYEAPRYEPQRKAPAKPKAQARPAVKADNRAADQARAIAAQNPLAGKYAPDCPDINLHGPTVRDVPDPNRKVEHPKYRELVTSDGGTQKYKLVKKIGEGGQGYCDLYQRTSDKTLLVCKVFTGSSRSSSDLFEIEIFQSILLPHPNIIDLKHWSRTTLWYEYCSGGDLHDIIDAHTHRRAKIPESFIWHCFLQLADAFAYLHTGYVTDGGTKPHKGWQPIVHRDVKPTNIFLRPSSNGNPYPDLVVADFGCATTKLRSGEKYQIGTPMYQPPELPIHTPQSDIWAVGACIHIMATGSPPVKAVPKDWKPEKWYEQPEARVVASLVKFGFSRQLDECMYAVMRQAPSERLTGKELVFKIERKWEEWKGRTEKLASWAMKK